MHVKVPPLSDRGVCPEKRPGPALYTAWSPQQREQWTTDNMLHSRRDTEECVSKAIQVLLLGPEETAVERRERAVPVPTPVPLSPHRDTPMGRSALRGHHGLFGVRVSCQKHDG